MKSDSNNLRICWHCRKEEVLVVGIGRIILKINSEKLRFRDLWSNPFEFDEVTRMSRGVHFVGQHDGEVTTLSMCKRRYWCLQQMMALLVKLWKESNVHPIAQFKPHNGWAVSSAIFLCSPNHQEEHTILVTGANHILISMLKRMDVKVSTMEQKISMMEQRTIAQEASESTLETSMVTSSKTSIETMFQKFDTTLQKRLAEQHFECTREPMNQLISMLKRMDKKISTMEQNISIMEQRTIAQEASESTLETSVVDSWKTSIETMLKKFDATMQKRLAKQHFESTHEPLALVVGDIIKSALSRTTPVLPSDGDTSSFTDSQQKNQISKDLEVKLTGLLRGEDYEKAFAEALGAADPSTK